MSLSAAALRRLFRTSIAAAPLASALHAVRAATSLRASEGADHFLAGRGGDLTDEPPSSLPVASTTSLLQNASPALDDTPYDLFIVIPSAAAEKERRDSIRETWAKYLTAPQCERCAQSKVGYSFVVGNETDIDASHREAAEFGDLAVLEDFGQQERYTKRSEKTFRTIRHAVQNFNFKFVLKCDTDSWVFVDRLLNYFDRHEFWGKDKLYAGNFRAGAGATALTDPTAKWYDPVYTEVTGLFQYPKHAKGAGYIISRSLAEGLSEQPLDWWEYVPSEDVAVGFWLMAAHKDTEDIPVEIQNTCAEDTVVDHYITPDVMRQRWLTYEATGTPCSSLPTPASGP